MFLDDTDKALLIKTLRAAAKRKSKSAQALAELVKKVEGAEHVNIHEKLTELETAFADAAFTKWHRDGEIEVDDTGLVSLSENHGGDGCIRGAYVQAWVWVYGSELPEAVRKEHGVKTEDDEDEGDEDEK
jgi:hypothetical protein